MPSRLEAQAYLAWEAEQAEQAEKHEYLNGEVFAMAGASEPHVTIAGNLFMALRNHLRGGPCSVVISDMRLHVQADNAYFYPGIFVTRAEADRAQSLAKSAPTPLPRCSHPPSAPTTGAPSSLLTARSRLPCANTCGSTLSA